MFNKKSVTRLSRYRRALLRFKDLGYSRIISTTLGEEVGVTASQVRKDFSTFGISGNKKGGYQIDQLLENLQNILGKNRIHQVILVGVGNIGAALLNYKGFDKEGIRIVAGFDIDRAKIQRKSAVPVFSLSELEPFVKKQKITTGIISVPVISAQEVCNRMVSAGIRGILNFAPIRLKVNKDVVITNVNILSKLESIFYFVDGFGQNA